MSSGPREPAADALDTLALILQDPALLQLYALRSRLSLAAARLQLMRVRGRVFSFCAIDTHTCKLVLSSSQKRHPTAPSRCRKRAQTQPRHPLFGIARQELSQVPPSERGGVAGGGGARAIERRSSTSSGSTIDDEDA